MLPVQDLVCELVMPKLLAAFVTWVSHKACDLQEVWQWYSGWKAMLQPVLDRATQEYFYLMCLMIKQKVTKEQPPQ